MPNMLRACSSPCVLVLSLSYSKILNLNGEDGHCKQERLRRREQERRARATETAEEGEVPQTFAACSCYMERGRQIPSSRVYVCVRMCTYTFSAIVWQVQSSGPRLSTPNYFGSYPRLASTAIWLVLSWTVTYMYMFVWYDHHIYAVLI